MTSDEKPKDGEVIPPERPDPWSRAPAKGGEGTIRSAARGSINAFLLKRAAKAATGAVQAKAELTAAEIELARLRQEYVAVMERTTDANLKKIKQIAATELDAQVSELELRAQAAKDQLELQKLEKEVRRAELEVRKARAEAELNPPENGKPQSRPRQKSSAEQFNELSDYLLKHGTIGRYSIVAEEKIAEMAAPHGSEDDMPEELKERVRQLRRLGKEWDESKGR